MDLYVTPCSVPGTGHDRSDDAFAHRQQDGIGITAVADGRGSAGGRRGRGERHAPAGGKLRNASRRLAGEARPNPLLVWQLLSAVLVALNLLQFYLQK